MEQLNSENVAIATDKLASTNIQVSSHVQRNSRRKLEDRFVVENDLNSAFDLDVSVGFTFGSVCFDLCSLPLSVCLPFECRLFNCYLIVFTCASSQ